MIAVIKVGGHQAIVQEGEVLRIDKLDIKEGEKISFETLLVSEPDGKNFQLGAPVLDGVSVEAKVLEHGRDAKIRVFKMKPRKRYRRTIGHRQDYTVVEIMKIGAGKATPQKISEDKKAEPKAKTETKASVKKTPAKKPTAKPVAKTAKKS